MQCQTMENTTQHLAPHLLRNWITREGRKVSWLANRIPVDRATLSQWLSGRRLPREVYRARLAEITGLPIAGAELWPDRENIR